MHAGSSPALITTLRSVKAGTLSALSKLINRVGSIPALGTKIKNNGKKTNRRTAAKEQEETVYLHKRTSQL
jgi:hypothetical protein